MPKIKNSSRWAGGEWGPDDCGRAAAIWSWWSGSLYWPASSAVSHPPPPPTTIPSGSARKHTHHVLEWEGGWWWRCFVQASVCHPSIPGYQSYPATKQEPLQSRPISRSSHVCLILASYLLTACWLAPWREVRRCWWCSKVHTIPGGCHKNCRRRCLARCIFTQTRFRWCVLLLFFFFLLCSPRADDSPVVVRPKQRVRQADRTACACAVQFTIAISFILLPRVHRQHSQMFDRQEWDNKFSIDAVNRSNPSLPPPLRHFNILTASPILGGGRIAVTRDRRWTLSHSKRAVPIIVNIGSFPSGHTYIVFATLQLLLR